MATANEYCYVKLCLLTSNLFKIKVQILLHFGHSVTDFCTFDFE